jgi:FtsP/CotA-like multicopper oxidase with cupredoxin domain
MDHTAANVYKGLVGFHLFFDEVDSGNENDPSLAALRLPSGEFDIPLLFQDKRFDANGQLCLDPLASNHQGFLGDKFVVNGAIQPKLRVLRRKYRFRLLNAGPSRFYQFFLTKNDVDQSFHHIGNDESLLEHPVQVTSVLLGVAERGDVVVDFSKFNKDDEVYLVNRLKMWDDGRGPEAQFDATSGEFTGFKVLPPGQGDQILRFDVGDDAPDPSQVPDTLRLNPVLPKWTETSPGNLKPPSELKALRNTKTFQLTQDSGSGEWLINLRSFHTSPSTLVRQNPISGDETDPTTDPQEERNTRPDGEIWTIVNDTGSDWSHPVHIHLEEFRILWRKNGKSPPAPPPLHEQSRKDVLRINPNEEVQIFVRFRDFLGKYPIHCHNVVHEDMSMMLRFDVVDDL